MTKNKNGKQREKIKVKVNDEILYITDDEDDDKEDNDIINKLLSVLENDEDNDMTSLSRKNIQKEKNGILQQLGFQREILKSYHEKLQDYVYVNDISRLKYGVYYRWINLKPTKKEQEQGIENSSLLLKGPAILTDIKVCEKNCEKNCENEGEDEGEDSVSLNIEPKIILYLKIHTRNRRPIIFSVNYDNVLLFRKLTDQEKLVIDIMNYLS
jgi:hypothetical protein